jgi:hypothetical protein
MARRGAEDGHGDEWIDQIAAGEHLKRAMKHAAEQARQQIEDDLEFVEMTEGPSNAIRTLTE